MRGKSDEENDENLRCRQPRRVEAEAVETQRIDEISQYSLLSPLILVNKHSPLSCAKTGLEPKSNIQLRNGVRRGINQII